MNWYPISWPILASELGFKGQLKPGGYTFDDFTLMIQSVISGGGVAVGWWHLTYEQLALGHLVRPLEEVFTIDRRHYLVVRDSHLQRNIDVQRVRAWLLERTAFLRNNSVTAWPADRSDSVIQ